MMPEAATPPAAPSFCAALAAPSSAPSSTEVPDLYGWLIGAWDAEVVDHLPAGTDRRQSAEMHFAWVLEGRAVQDVWIAPARGERSGPPGAGNRYGATLRWWDASIAAWRVAWTSPASGAENRLVARQVGPDVVQTGADAAGRLIRWIFTDIRADRFHWRGEASLDGGTWICETEFFARRRNF